MPPVLVERVLRGLAIVIIVAAVVDPASSALRRVPPTIAIVGGDDIAGARDGSQLSARVVGVLEGSNIPVRGALPGAEVTVVLPGGDLHAVDLAKPVVAITSDTTAPAVQLVTAHAPQHVIAGRASSVSWSATVNAATEDSLVAELRDGATLLDRIAMPIDAGQSRVRGALAMAAAASGSHNPLVHVSLASAPAARDSAAVVVQARDTPWRVFFFDARASWMSTFVRRAVQGDARFDVSSRVITSRNLSSVSGNAPAGIGDAGELDRFDVVVVGAPDALNDRDVAGLETFMRRRGGSVVLLFDAAASGAVNRLADVARWRLERTATSWPVLLREGAQSNSATRVALRATEILAPDPLPAGAKTIAVAARGDTVPVLYETSVGAGLLLTSTVLDAWRFRDRAESDFELLWPAMLGSAAMAAMRPLDIAVDRQPALPGEAVTVIVTARDVALAATDSSRELAMSASIGDAGQLQRIPLYPTAAAGVLTGRFKAPRAPGRYWLRASIHDATAGTPAPGQLTDSIPLAVSLGAARIASSADAPIVAAASSGLVMTVSRLGTLESALDDLVEAPVERVTWYPMRSPWWIFPVAMLLGAEWWLRRRRGLS